MIFSWRNLPHVPVIIAHRGSSANRPENTMAAFQKAVEDGADAIELDVRLTNDNEVVVIHDAKLERTTNGQGYVRDFNLRELKQLSAGLWYHRRFLSEKIPTLDEVLKTFSDKISLNIEIKADRGLFSKYTLAERCCQIVRWFHAEETALVSSFSMPLIKRLKLLEPRVATAVLYHPVHHFGIPPLAVARKASANFLILSGSTLRKKIICTAHEQKILTGEYTVNTFKRFKRAKRFGVDAVITNDPLKFSDFLK